MNWKNIYHSQPFKIMELIFIYIGIPLLYKYQLIPFHKFMPLLLVFVVCLLVVGKDKAFNRNVLRLNGFCDWKPILARVAFFFLAAATGVYFSIPNSLFLMPRQEPVWWVSLLIYYPLLSAYPQELIFRTYFFHRYKGLINNNRVLILLNSALFSFSHIVFNNWIAIVMTFVGSLIFTRTYLKSNSLPATAIEHALYGNVIFTVGLNDFF